MRFLVVFLVVCSSLCAHQQVGWKKRAQRQSGASLGHPRDYKGGVTECEAADVRFIVSTLANKSLITIAKEKSNLEAAGDRIDHVHPLNFLLVIFTDEELKVGIRNIRGKGWVWSSFVCGIKTTLATESAIRNVMPYLSDFAKKLEVNQKLLLPAVRAGNWDQFVDLLIQNVPRKDDGRRFDC